VTLTTVGYGDISPITPLGRVIGGCLMIMGMFVLALFAGIIGHTLLNAVLSISKEQFRMSNYMNHIVVCGYDEGARILLDVLRDEASQLKTDVVLFAPHDRPQDIPPQFIWAQGDPSKEADLAKARIQYASAVVVVASRKISPQMADANTILTIFTLRAWLKRHQSTLRRAKPLYIAAEVLEPENVIHAHTAGADEVIETTRLGFSLLGHAISEPGTSAIVSSVASFGQHSLYIGPNPMAEAMSFGALSDALHQRHGIMLLGVRGEQDSDQVNPPRTLRVEPHAELIYLGEKSVLKAKPS
jgi:voltage-gated potassium channel